MIEGGIFGEPQGMYKNRVKTDRIRKSRAIPAGKFKIIYIILNLPAQDFLVGKIKAQEFQKSFRRSLPYFYTYPG